MSRELPDRTGRYPWSRDAIGRTGYRVAHPGRPNDSMFLFFSNRLGCLGSLIVSALITVVLLLILGVL
jgi:hypothetical protein